MLAKVMGAAVFSIGFFMLVLALADLLALGGLRYNDVQRIFIYLGGIILCVLGYFMARRFPRVEVPPEEVVQPPTEVQEGPPPERY
jgi:cytochrome c biogenesis protein CcdA